ncbi:MAG: hypothetical protein ABWX69_09580 [Arthrobacter sp.]
MEVPSSGEADPGEWGGEQPDIHPLIARAFRVLEESGFPWVLLRGEDDLARPDGDVDILVGADRIQRLDGPLAAVGFRRLSARGHGSHRFYFCYDATEDLWLKLDVVTEITFGPLQQWQTPLARGCLKRRIRNGLLWLPATTEQAWLQLLHIMLDKGGAVKPGRMDRVRVAGALASIDDVIAAYVDQQVGPGTAAQLLRLVRAGSSSDFRAPAVRMASAFTRNAPLRTRMTAAKSRLLRLIGPTFPGRFGRGIVVGVVGSEGPGKTALLHRLGESFPVPGRYVRLGSMGPGRWDGLLRRVPGGRFGCQTISQTWRALAAEYHYLRGRLVLVDWPAYSIAPPRSAAAAAKDRTETALAFAVAPAPEVILVLDGPTGVLSEPGGGPADEFRKRRRHGRRDGVERLPRTCVFDAAQPQALIQRLAAEVVWGQLAGSAAPAAAQAGSGQPGFPTPESGGQP